MDKLMAWIKAKNSDEMINLDFLRCISLEEDCILLEFSRDEYDIMSYNSNEEAEKAYDELYQMLVQDGNNPNG